MPAETPVTFTLRSVASPLQSAQLEVRLGAEGMTVQTDPSSIIRTSVILDYRYLYSWTTSRWYGDLGQGHAVTVTVFYHGWQIGQTIFTPLLPEGFEAGADDWWDAWATDPNELASGAADALFEVLSYYYGATCDAQFLVDEVCRRVAADVQFICGHQYIDRYFGSGIVGGLQIVRWLGSGLVEGWRLDRSLGSGVVQGWKIERSFGSGLVGISFVYRGLASGVVGIETLQRFLGSGVVFGLQRGSILEVHVVDESTYLALQSIGVSWS